MSDERRTQDSVTYVEFGGLVELLFLPEHEPITGHDLSTLHQQEREQENGDQDVSVSGAEVRLVDLPGNGTNVPFFILHDRLALLELLLEGGDHVRAVVTLPFLDFSRGFAGNCFLFLL